MSPKLPVYRPVADVGASAEEILGLAAVEWWALIGLWALLDFPVGMDILAIGGAFALAWAVAALVDTFREDA